MKSKFSPHFFGFFPHPPHVAPGRRRGGLRAVQLRAQLPLRGEVPQVLREKAPRRRGQLLALGGVHREARDGRRMGFLYMGFYHVFLGVGSCCLYNIMVMMVVMMVMMIVDEWDDLSSSIVVL